PALWPSSAVRESALRGPEPRGWSPFHSWDRAEQTVGSDEVLPATVPSTAQPRQPGLSYGCTAAARCPTCSRRHEHESFCVRHIVEKQCGLVRRRERQKL